MHVIPRGDIHPPFFDGDKCRSARGARTMGTGFTSAPSRRNHSYRHPDGRKDPDDLLSSVSKPAMDAV